MAASYLEEKFKETRPESADEACSLLTEKLLTFKRIIGEQNLCDGEAEALMCESLKRMFVNVEAGLLGDCAFDCTTPDGVPTVPPGGAVEVSPLVPTAAGRNGLTGPAAAPAPLAALAALLPVALAALLHR